MLKQVVRIVVTAVKSHRCLRPQLGHEDKNGNEGKCDKEDGGVEEWEEKKGGNDEENDYHKRRKKINRRR
jgi:hypothetical protein